MFLKCSDLKFLHLYHDFMQFMETYCRYQLRFMKGVKEKLNKRREKILGYKSIYGPYYIIDLYRTASRKELNDIMVETEKKRSQMNQDFFSSKYKQDYLTEEIKELKRWILKIDVKIGQSETDDNVSTARFLKTQLKLYLGNWRSCC